MDRGSQQNPSSYRIPCSTHAAYDWYTFTEHNHRRHIKTLDKHRDKNADKCTDKETYAQP